MEATVLNTNETKGDWRDRQVARAEAAFAEPFRARMKVTYRQAADVPALRAIHRECVKVRDDANRQCSRYSNFTLHGTHRYDSYDYLYCAADDFAEQIAAKIER